LVFFSSPPLKNFGGENVYGLRNTSNLFCSMKCCHNLYTVFADIVELYKWRLKFVRWTEINLVEQLYSTK
jgi:hypothetical protein